MTRLISVLFICIAFIGCESDSPGPGTNGEGWMIKRIYASDQSDVQFDYDNNGRLIKLSSITPGRTTFYFFYQGDRIHYVVCDYKDYTFNDYKKASVVFQYSTDGSWVKLYYKQTHPAMHTDPPNTDPYFSTINDGYLSAHHDSIRFSNSGQINEIFRYADNLPQGLFHHLKLYYGNTHDSSLQKIVLKEIHQTSIFDTHELLLTQPGYIKNPLKAQGWFFSCLPTLQWLTATSGDMSMGHVLFTERTIMSDYDCLLPRLPQSYEIISTDPFGDYTSPPIEYQYESNGTELYGKVPAGYVGETVKFEFIQP
jgi:hypothetical protein